VGVGQAVIPLKYPERFTPYRPTRIEIAPRELIRITRNGKTKDGHRLNNGSVYSVKGFDRQGRIILANGWKLGDESAFIDHAYVITSHSAQGKTVRHAIVAESSTSFPAASAEQFNVSVSRGRRTTIYTDDKHALREAVQRADDRMTATEFINGRVSSTKARHRGMRRDVGELDGAYHPPRNERELAVSHER